GHPIITFTCDGPERVLPANGAHTSYLEVMRRGLVETWGLDDVAASAYLAERNQGSKPSGSGR
ncbi:MAG: hypothetical protein ACR2QK_12730, partial [Acidimicrobiales bacterium]